MSEPLGLKSIREKKKIFIFILKTYFTEIQAACIVCFSTKIAKQEDKIISKKKNLFEAN